MFSAVNSAFIVVTMDALSPDPADRTNALLEQLLSSFNNQSLPAGVQDTAFSPGGRVVRQNCLFFASLFSSLLAAAGAVLAKQWLAHYERTGQTGPLDEQGLRRTKKFLGAKKWKLGHMVEALPMLILLSLGLFFIGIADYLWTLNRAVAAVATAFSAVGTALYMSMLLAAAVFPDCPYQTAPSVLLARFGRYYGAATTKYLKSALEKHQTRVVELGGRQQQSRFTHVVWCLLQWVTPDASTEQTPPRNPQSSALLADTAISLWTLAPRRDILLAIAWNFPTLQDPGDMIRVLNVITIPALMKGLQDAIVSKSIGQEEHVLVLARTVALARIVSPWRAGVHRLEPPPDKIFRRALRTDSWGLAMLLLVIDHNPYWQAALRDTDYYREIPASIR